MCGNSQPRSKSPKIREVEMMTGTLEAWGGPTYLDEGPDHGSIMSGMVSADDMADLETLHGAEFDTVRLKATSAHHEGAIEKANDLLEKGDDATAESTQKIIDGQATEIERMKSLLGERTHSQRECWAPLEGQPGG